MPVTGLLELEPKAKGGGMMNSGEENPVDHDGVLPRCLVDEVMTHRSSTSESEVLICVKKNLECMPHMKYIQTCTC